MLLTIILLSHNNDNNLLEIINNFILNSPNCNLLIADSGKERKNIIESIKHDSKIKIIFNENKGIYASLNNALKKIETEYYLVLGLDDILDFSVLKKFIISLKKDKVDLLFAGVIKAGRKLLFLDKNKRSILNGPAGTFPSHTGGIAIKKELHSKFGDYSLDFKVISDLFFISSCFLGNCSSRIYKDFLSEIGAKGFSKKNEDLAEYESMIIRNKFGASKTKSFFIYLLRINKRKLKRIIFLIKNVLTLIKL